MRITPMLVLGLPLLVLAAASCGGRSSPSGVAGASASRVTVQEQEYKLTLSTRTIAAGKTQFVVVNHGRLPHALEIDGPGVSDVRTPGTVMPGASKTLTVTLRGGTYEIYCPVPGHKQRGMDTHIKVGSRGGMPSGTTTGSGGGGGSTWG